MWDEVLLLLVPFRSQIFDAFRHLKLFRPIVILPYINAISVDFYAVKCLIYIYFVWFPCKWKNAYINDLYALRILMNFLCIYLGEKRGMHECMCMGTHSQPLIQNRLMDVYETWWEWSAHGLAHALRCFGHICSGADPGRGKIGHGVHFFKKTFSSNLKATETNRIYSNDVEACVMKCSCFWFHLLVNFFYPWI